jgi:hypothetical protein
VLAEEGCIRRNVRCCVLEHGKRPLHGSAVVGGGLGHGFVMTLTTLHKMVAGQRKPCGCMSA